MNEILKLIAENKKNDSKVVLICKLEEALAADVAELRLCAEGQPNEDIASGLAIAAEWMEDTEDWMEDTE